jgi:hypothetical protein
MYYRGSISILAEITAHFGVFLNSIILYVEVQIHFAYL